MKRKISILLSTIIGIVLVHGIVSIQTKAVNNSKSEQNNSVKSTSEIVWFRADKSNRVGRGRCYQFSLNENIIANIDGQTGPGCSFIVNNYAAGEWVFTGGYYNTPPYAWESNQYHQTSRGDFSFTCGSPSYALDNSSLPSFVTMDKTESLPPSGARQQSGKRYYFLIADSALSGQSFNLKFSYTATCQMKRQNDGVLTPVEKTSNSCGQARPIEINPRQGVISLPISLSESCISSTPTPTPKPPQCYEDCDPGNNQCPLECPICRPAEDDPDRDVCQPPACGEPCDPDQPNQCPEECSICPEGVENPVCQPEPTSTPMPTLTSTPIPTSTATPIPSSTPVPSCDCDGIEYSGDFIPGGKVTFTTYATVSDPTNNPAEVVNMVYQLERVGVPVADGVQVSAQGPTYDSQRNVDRYQTSWTYNIPASGSGQEEYYIKVKINCAWKQAISYNSLLADGKTMPQCSDQKIFIMSSHGKKDQSFWQSILTFLANIFGAQQTTSVPTPSQVPSVTAIPVSPINDSIVILAPENAQTVQLGTFDPFATVTPFPTPTPRVEKGCTFIRFWINY